MNTAILIGRLGKEPDTVTTGTGKKVSKFSLATSKKINGESVTQWHNIVCWEKLAEIVEKYIKKGSQIMVQGEIQYRSYEKDGQTRYMTEILANNIEMLGSSQSEQRETAPANSYSQDPNPPLPTNEQNNLPF